MNEAQRGCHVLSVKQVRRGGTGLSTQGPLAGKLSVSLPGQHTTYRTAGRLLCAIWSGWASWGGGCKEVEGKLSLYVYLTFHGGSGRNGEDREPLTPWF